MKTNPTAPALGADAIDRDEGMSRPAIILVKPQLGENIGHVARAMLNFGLTDLRLVAPRDGWPNPSAISTAAGADAVLKGAKVFETVEAAIGDLNRVYAASVRQRDLPKPVIDPGEAAKRLHEAEAEGLGAGILFGPERSGLANEAIVLADAVVTIPVNRSFSSLNLGQAVILIAYEWFRASGGEALPSSDAPIEPPASREELIGLFEHLEKELGPREYFRPPARRPAMVLTLRNLLQGAGFNALQVRTLRGVVASLVKKPKGD